MKWGIIDLKNLDLRIIFHHTSISLSLSLNYISFGYHRCTENGVLITFSEKINHATKVFRLMKKSCFYPIIHLYNEIESGSPCTFDPISICLMCIRIHVNEFDCDRIA